MVAPERPDRVLGVRPRRAGTSSRCRSRVGSDGVLRNLQRDATASVMTAEDVGPPRRAGQRGGALARCARDGVARHASSRPIRLAGPRRGGRRGPLPTVAGEPPGAAIAGGLHARARRARAAAGGDGPARHRDGHARADAARRPRRGVRAARTACSARSRAATTGSSGPRPRTARSIAATGYGFVGTTSILFSDFLGDRNLYVATDRVPGLDRGDERARDLQLPAAPLGLGRRRVPLQELLPVARHDAGRAAERARRSSASATFGALFQLSYPFDRFRRLDVADARSLVERTFFFQDAPGYYERGPRQLPRVTSPSFSLVGDNSLSSYYGPVNGSRYNLTFSPAFQVTGNASRTRRCPRTTAATGT